MQGNGQSACWRWLPMGVAMVCLGCLPPSGGGSRDVDDDVDGATSSSPANGRAEAVDRPGNVSAMMGDDDSFDAPDGDGHEEHAGQGENEGDDDAHGHHHEGEHDAPDSPGEFGGPPECNMAMSNVELVDYTCAWLEACWRDGIDLHGREVCRGFGAEESDAWDNMCRLAPLDVALGFCDFQSCADAAEVWRTYPVEFERMCDGEGGTMPAEPSEGSPAGSQPVGPDPEPNCDAGDDELSRCLQGCDWLVACGERPQCSGSTVELRTVCETTCDELPEQLGVILCQESNCELALDIMAGSLGADVPECDR